MIGMLRLATLLMLLLALPANAFAQAAGPVAAPAAAEPSAPPAKTDSGYVLGVDDMLEVAVLGASDFTSRVQVRADGTIPLPYLGPVEAAGQTALTLGAMLAERLRAKGIYANPTVNVQIVSFASRYVTLLGEVGTPGLQPVNRAYRVSEIIARAGGIRDTGADYVNVTRTEGKELRLPFVRLARGGEADDPLVQPGDKIFVPKAELFYIYGQVNAPGVYPVKDGITLRKAIARGGGLTASGSEKRVKLLHDGQQMQADLEQAIQPGDVIVVGERLF